MKLKVDATTLCYMLPLREFLVPQTPDGAELAFHPRRKWRFDYCYPLFKVAIEVDGGVYSGGRHTRGRGYENDQEKRNEAQLLGWLVLNVTPRMLQNGYAFDVIYRALRLRVSEVRPDLCQRLEEEAVPHLLREISH